MTEPGIRRIELFMDGASCCAVKTGEDEDVASGSTWSSDHLSESVICDVRIPPTTSRLPAEADGSLAHTTLMGGAASWHD